MKYKPFFRREAEANGEIPDVWTYDNLPKNVRVQIWQTFMDSYARRYAEEICKILRHELGVETLTYQTYWSFDDKWDYEDELRDCFFADITNARLAFSIVEYISIFIKSLNTQDSKKEINEINYRLKEARIGYEFNTDANMLIKKSDEAVYKLSIEPAFHLLSDLKFKESIDNFAKAFSDYQSGTTKDLENAITNALKALESTIKNICKLKGYEFNEEKPLKDHVALLKNKKFLP